VLKAKVAKVFASFSKRSSFFEKKNQKTFATLAWSVWGLLGSGTVRRAGRLFRCVDWHAARGGARSSSPAGL
jgi:hypothetical protein